MPRKVQFRKLSDKERIQIMKQIVAQKNYDILVNAMVTATVFVVIIVIIDIMRNEFADDSSVIVAIKIVSLWVFAVGMWFGLNKIEQAFTKKKLEKMKDD